MSYGLKPSFEEFTKAPLRHITNHVISRVSHRIQLFLERTDHAEGPWEGFSFDEFMVHDADEQLVLDYWKSRGGRTKVTGLQRFHVFHIIAERFRHKKREYEVQWVGYSREETNWEPAAKMKRICPKAIEEWQQSQSGRS